MGIIGFYCIEVRIGVSSELSKLLSKKKIFVLIILPVLSRNDG